MQALACTNFHVDRFMYLFVIVSSHISQCAYRVYGLAWKMLLHSVAIRNSGQKGLSAAIRRLIADSSVSLSLDERIFQAKSSLQRSLIKIKVQWTKFSESSNQIHTFCYRLKIDKIIYKDNFIQYICAFVYVKCIVIN